MKGCQGHVGHGAEDTKALGFGLHGFGLYLDEGLGKWVNRGRSVA